MKPGPNRVEIGWCTGKDCRKCDGFAALQAELAADCAVVELPCLDYCKGPVAVADPRSAKPRVFGKLRKKGVRELIAHVLHGEPLGERLLKRRLSGSHRTKARKRIARALR